MSKERHIVDNEIENLKFREAVWDIDKVLRFNKSDIVLKVNRLVMTICGE